MTTHLSEAEYCALVPGSKAAKRSKYRAVPAVVTDAGELYEAKAAKANGILGQRFDSKAEAKRYLELRLMERAGLIRELVCQPRYDLHGLDGSIACRYRGDFSYVDMSLGANVCEDVKGAPNTAVFRIKAKLLAAEHGVRIVEVRA